MPLKMGSSANCFYRPTIAEDGVDALYKQPIAIYRKSSKRYPEP
jgi:hypothetical protein